MAKRIYIGNMSFNTTEESLRKLFSGFGEVSSVQVVSDKVSGLSKGFGFVNMEDDVAAGKAIHSLNGKDFEGRKLRINYAQERIKTNNASSYKRNETE